MPLRMDPVPSHSCTAAKSSQTKPRPGTFGSDCQLVGTDDSNPPARLRLLHRNQPWIAALAGEGAAPHIFGRDRLGF
jgi:hypothetical protein